MRNRFTRLSLAVVATLIGSCLAPALAQQSVTVANVVQVTGLPGIKAHTKGSLAVASGSLQFTHAKEKSDLAVSSIQDVVTGNDSQRVVRGTLGTLSMFAPYEAGRFLSLFRTKIDTLTVEYRDADGGLHGVIFTLPVGKADLIKKELLAQGAPTTIPSVPEDTHSSAPAASDTKEPKP